MVANCVRFDFFTCEDECWGNNLNPLLVEPGRADRGGDVDSPEACRGCDHLPDVAQPEAQRHPADAHPKHGQHLQFLVGGFAHPRRQLSQSGQ